MMRQASDVLEASNNFIHLKPVLTQATLIANKQWFRCL